MGLAAAVIVVSLAAIVAAIMVYGAVKQLIITGRLVWKSLMCGSF